MNEVPQQTPRYRRQRGADATRSLAAIFLALLGCLTTQGCSWTTKDGTIHTLVIGAGYLRTRTEPGVSVANATLLGLAAGPEISGAGFLYHHQVSIDPAVATNLMLSVKATPFRLQLTNISPLNATIATHSTNKTIHP